LTSTEMLRVNFQVGQKPTCHQSVSKLLFYAIISCLRQHQKSRITVYAEHRLFRKCNFWSIMYIPQYN